MLAVAPRDEREGEKIGSFSIGGSNDDFLNFCDDNTLLESINFDDLFEGIEDEDHVLPDLEMDPEILPEFSVSGGEESEMNTTSGSCEKIDENSRTNQEEEDKVSGSSCLINHSTQGDESTVANPSANKGAGKGRKSSKNLQGKRKVKVDWTPELHRRFVQAVKQLGVDKAVPSRILELMGIDCLTRHNIASHLQKYRSHRKHLLAREAEAASWNQRQQVCGAAATGGGGGCKREMMMSSPLLVPTIGFLPMTRIPPPHFSRPLHVWGHPSMDQSLKHIWPKHLPLSSRSPLTPPPTWPPAAAPSPHLPPPPSEPSFWHSRHQHVPNTLIAGTHFFPPPSLAVTTRYPAPVPVPGIPSYVMYKVDPTAAAPPPPTPAGQTSPLLPFDVHPSKESIDAAIGDVLSKPWLPLPLGLKPPSADSVVVELHRQGIEKIPPPCSSAS